MITLPEDFRGTAWLRIGDRTYTAVQGYADLPNEVPLTLNTRFPTASLGKGFVAVAILQCIEEGKLAFDSRLSELVDFDLRRIDRDITVYDLLTHTSGIPDYFDESVMDDYDALWVDYPNYRIRTSRDLLPLFIDKPMMYPRGARFQYNNTGFAVLGMILEALEGEPFDAVLKRRVFDRCCMADTGYFALDRLPARCANAYCWDAAHGEFYTHIYSVDAKGTGAGGAYTTLPDLQRFWDGLMGGTLLSPDLLAQMLTPHAHESATEHYGLGLWLKDAETARLLPTLEGCDPGVSCISGVWPEKGVTLTVVSNFGDNVWAVRRAILKQLGA